MLLVLDTMIVSALCTPKAADHQRIAQWLRDLLTLSGSSVGIVLPEVVDYEVRRGLLHIAKRSGVGTTKALSKLDALGASCKYLPLSTPTMKRAADLWADAQIRGRPTGGPDTFDGDPILAAQALEVGGTVVTENVRHLAQFVPVRQWSAIDPKAP